MRLERAMYFVFFNDTATTEIYTNLNTLSLHDALPIFYNLFTQHVIYLLWRDTTSELWTPVL